MSIRELTDAECRRVAFGNEEVIEEIVVVGRRPDRPSISSDFGLQAMQEQIQQQQMMDMLASMRSDSASLSLGGGQGSEEDPDECNHQEGDSQRQDMNVQLFGIGDVNQINSPELRQRVIDCSQRTLNVIEGAVASSATSQAQDSIMDSIFEELGNFISGVIDAFDIANLYVDAHSIAEECRGLRDAVIQDLVNGATSGSSSGSSSPC